jgi:hypothetical protein
MLLKIKGISMNFKKNVIIALSSLSIFASAYVISGPQYDEEWVYSSSSAYSDIVGGKNTSCFSGTKYWGERTNYSRLVHKMPCFPNKKI